MLSGWAAAAATVAWLVPGWCALAGFRLARGQQVPDRPFADGMLSIVLSVGSFTVLHGLGLAPSATPSLDHAVSALGLIAAISLPAATGFAVGRVLEGHARNVIVALDDGTIVRGTLRTRREADRDTLYLSNATVSPPGVQAHHVADLEVTTTAVRMIRYRS
jgi:hypothetical protein